MSEKIAIAISGAAGRMGRRLIALGSAEDNLKIAAAWDSPSHPDFGADSGQLAGIGPNGVPIRSITDDSTPVDVIIDFSTPAATDELIAQALKRRS
ncbi:MAG: 4-hydroxy-tetrahydrodipicolinate reductase, partial [Thermoguttaceae bacterium]|nr:4-hydroxy-tetrahydrodipicolinate reductase [Thermoguttaceae bacterium]